VGVTIFGIFLTPVFFSVIMNLSETSLFESAAVRWIGSTVVAGTAGSGIAFLFARLARAGTLRVYWAIGLGGTVGVVAALLALGVRERMRYQTSSARAPSPAPHLKLGASRGEPKS
jgi:hypothetical protein